MACGGVEDTPGLSEEGLEGQAQAVATTNGLSVNGLSVNGLSVNGLSVNGLSVNGLSSATFQDWFEVEPATRDRVMKYLVLCAVPAGETRTYTSAVTLQTYHWAGQFGLAPMWSQGMTAPSPEQQLVTACLAAHTNKFGINIPISVLGRNTQGHALSFTLSELATYSETEACFFGNAFTNEGVFAANDRTFLHASESTARACGLSSKQGSTDCAPITHVGACKDFCTLDVTRTHYTQCTYNGVSYKPITTRIQPQGIYRCGDGVCQFTERCGTGNTYDNCAVDCGACQ